jgi:hypothetical protein
MATFGEYSEVAICNLALQEIGRGMMITALDENSQAARACKLRYPYARDAALRGYDWNFAAARAELPALAELPAFGYGRQYELPSDCLRVRSLENGEADDWKVEGRRILTDMGAPIRVKYTARVTDPVQFDALFVAALSARIAADVAVSLSESTSKAQGLWQVYLGKLHEAWKNDAIEGQADALPQGSWVGARFGQNVRPYSDWDPNV